MRASLTVLLVLAAALALPTAPADTERGSSAGVNGGYVQAGLWDVYTFDKTGGYSTAVFELTWVRSLFPGADYDLRLYRQGALDDGVLTDDELIVETTERSWDDRHEVAAATLPEGKYVVAVVPFQAQYETYTLRADPGWLNYVGQAPGVQLVT